MIWHGICFGINYVRRLWLAYLQFQKLLKREYINNKKKCNPDLFTLKGILSALKIGFYSYTQSRFSFTWQRCWKSSKLGSCLLKIRMFLVYFIHQIISVPNDFHIIYHLLYCYQADTYWNGASNPTKYSKIIKCLL